jgi:hypothetical protein
MSGKAHLEVTGTEGDPPLPSAGTYATDTDRRGRAKEMQPMAGNGD